MIEKIKVVAEYDGAAPCKIMMRTNVDVNGYECEEWKLPMDEIKYHTSIEWLYPVAGMVVKELVSIVSSEGDIWNQLSEYIKLNEAIGDICNANNTFDVSQLFEAVFQGILIINKFKSEKNGQTTNRN